MEERERKKIEEKERALGERLGMSEPQNVTGNKDKVATREATETVESRTNEGAN